MKAISYFLSAALLIVNWSVTTPAYQANVMAITSGGSVTVTGAVAGTAASSTTIVGTQLTAQLFFGDVSSNNKNGKVTIVMPIRLSSEINYRIVAQMTALDPGSGVAATDIGFGVANFRAQRPDSNQLEPDAISGIQINGNFGADPRLASIDADGLPSYQATLNNIGAISPTELFTGPDTVRNGSFNRDNNSILADLIFVITPQFFTPSGNFSVLLTLTILP